MSDENLSVAPDNRSEADLDQLANDNQVARNSDRPMSAPKEQEKKPDPSKEEFQFTHNGKPVKATRDQIIKWAQQGYDYPQRAQKLNQEKSKWEQDRQNWEKQWGIYRQIDEFAQKNQDWWTHIQQSWQGRQNPGYSSQPPSHPQSGQPAIGAEFQPYLSKLQTLEQTVQQIVPALQQFQQERELSKQKQEDDKLDHEIQSIRDQHKDLDWESLDENGKSLEHRVLEHAQSTGIPSFRAALRDLLHDDLLSRAQAQAKQSLAKGIQTRTRLGVLGESSTPQGGKMPDRNKSIRDTSYEELEQEIKDEIRRGKAS